MAGGCPGLDRVVVRQKGKFCSMWNRKTIFKIGPCRAISRPQTARHHAPQRGPALALSRGLPAPHVTAPSARNAAPSSGYLYGQGLQLLPEERRQPAKG